MEFGGVDVFVMEQGDRSRHDALVLLHGFPSSSYDVHAALPRLLEGGRRVVALDVPGFGLSAKPKDYGYSLFEQAEIVALALRALGVRTVDLVAHDMGTSIAAELCARRERGLLDFALRSLVLTNGSVYVEMAQLTPSQKLLLSPAAPFFARLSSYATFRIQLRRILSRPVAEDELRAMWAQMLYRGGRARMPQLIGYVRERYRFATRWTGALSRLDLPTLVLWGEEDPVAVRGIAERLVREIPGASAHWLRGVGHYPMLEAADEWASAIAEFLAVKAS